DLSAWSLVARQEARKAPQLGSPGSELKRAILPSYEFTPRGPQLWGLSCFLTRDQAPSRKCRAGRKHVLPSLFYGNSRTKFSRRLNLFVRQLRAPWSP